MRVGGVSRAEASGGREFRAFPDRRWRRRIFGMSETIGFIGLGRMGTAMAANVLSAGFPLRVYNRTSDKAEPLIEKGAAPAKTPADAAPRGGIAITMLSDDGALRAVATDEFARALGARGIHLSMSTVLPATNESLAEQHRRHGVALVAAPVFGRPEAAAARKLWVCASGPAEAVNRVRPVLDAMGQGVFEFGDAVGAANVVKLAGNFLLTAAIEAMAEAAAMGEKNGVPRDRLLGMLTQTLFNCQIYTGYGKRLIDTDFDKVGFALPLALKDMRLARQTAEAANVSMPVLNLLCHRYLTLLAGGRDNLDASALALGAAGDAGMEWMPK